VIGSARTGLGSVRTAGQPDIADLGALGIPSVVLETAEINLLTGSLNNPFGPTRSGWYFTLAQLRWHITAIAGGAPAVGVGGNVGNNVTKNNIALNTANFMTAAQLANAFAGGVPWVGVSAQNTTSTTLVDGGAPFMFDVTTPASGGGVTTLRGKLFLVGFWTPA